MSRKTQIQYGITLRKSMTTFLIAMISAFLLNTGGVIEWIEQMTPGQKKTLLHEVTSPIHSLSDQLGLTYPRAELKHNFKNVQSQPFWWMTPTANAQSELPFLVTIYLPFGFTVQALRSSRTSKPAFSKSSAFSANLSSCSAQCRQP